MPKIFAQVKGGRAPHQACKGLPLSRSINWDSSSKDGHEDRRNRRKRKRAKNMPVLEARGESLYLVDRCAPCKGYRGTLLHPTSPYRWSLGPLPPSRTLYARPFTYGSRPGEQNHAKERQSQWTCLLFQRRSLSRDLVAWTLRPFPLHQSRRYKPIRSEERRIRWTSCVEHIQRSQPFHFLGGGETKTVSVTITVLIDDALC